MAVPGDVRHILPAGQRRPRRGRQSDVLFEVHVIVAGQVRRRGHGLEVHLDAVQVGGDIPESGVIHVGRNDNGDVIAPDAGVLGGGQCSGIIPRAQLASRLFGSQPQPVAVDGGGVQENLPQGQHLGVVVGIAENGLAVFLKFPGGNSENLIFRAPAQDKGSRRISTVRQRGGGLCNAGEIDIAAGQDLVLDQPGATSECHYFTAPFMNLLMSASTSAKV